MGKFTAFDYTEIKTPNFESVRISQGKQYTLNEYYYLTYVD